MWTRRSFLRGSAALVGAGSFVPQWIEKSFASDAARTASDDRRVLVIVQLSGGNDGLNTVVPKCDGSYYKARPKLAIAPEKTLALDDDFGLHPSLAPLHARFLRGEVAVLHGVGYPKPSRSHFRSMDVWHSARLDGDVESAGWVGRGLDVLDTRGEASILGTNLGSSVPRALRRDGTAILSFDSEGSLELAADRNHTGGRAAQIAAFRAIASRDSARERGASAKLELVRATSAAALANSDAVLACLDRAKNQTDYPDNLGHRLSTAARVIVGNLGARVIYVSMGGYDTHAKQADAHAKLLANFAKSIDAFFADLEKQGRAQDVALFAFSEFGRRLEENASAGTDHGTAAPVFVVSPKVRGGVIGEPLDLNRLVDGDPLHTTDFRAVYAALLEEWLGVESVPVLGEPFERPKLFT